MELKHISPEKEYFHQKIKLNKKLIIFRFLYKLIDILTIFLNYSKNDHSENLKKIIRKNIDGISKISSERLLDELKKIFKSKKFLNLNIRSS